MNLDNVVKDTFVGSEFDPCGWAVCLQYEQCLTRFGQWLNRQVLACLEVADGSQTMCQIEETIVSGLIIALQAALDEWVVEMALPQLEKSTDDAEILFRVHRSPQEILRSPTIDWQKPFHLLTLEPLTQMLTQPDLQLLQANRSMLVLPIMVQQVCRGWVLISASASLVANDEAVQVNPFVTNFVEQSLQQCTIALEQINRVRSHHQNLQALQARNHELEQTNRLKSEFLANTSHEIRTPLSSILGFTHLLLQQGYNPTNLRHQEYLKIILTSGQHLLGLINDILDMSKIEANQLTLEWEIVDVAEVCKIVTAIVKEKASDKGLAIQLELDPRVTTLEVDGLRLKQMLVNLLSNAVKFTTTGSVGLRVVPVDDYLHFMVWDTGTGISQTQQALLFKPYSQIRNEVVARGEGTGLGLALTQKLAELHGGRIEVQSEVNQGSCFTIALPLRTTVTLQQEPDSVVEEGQSILSNEPISDSLLPQVQSADAATLSQRNNGTFSAPEVLGVRPNGILLVEDHVLNAKLVLTYLSRLGYEVTWAKNAADLWDALGRSLPTVILMDIHLPDVDGLTLIRQLKEDERYQPIPVIAQTAMAMKGDRDVCLQAGADDYISKPINLETLANLMARYVGVMLTE